VPTHLVPWTRDSDDDKRRLLKLCEELAQVAAKEEHVV